MRLVLDGHGGFNGLWRRGVVRSVGGVVGNHRRCNGAQVSKVSVKLLHLEIYGWFCSGGCSWGKGGDIGHNGHGDVVNGRSNNSGRFEGLRPLVN